MTRPSSPSAASVEFRRVSLPGGCPGVISHLVPGHRIIAYVGEAHFDPVLTSRLDQIGRTALELLQPVEETRPKPALRVRVRRSGDLGSELAVAEIDAEDLVIGVDQALMSADLATFLSEAGTRVTRDFVRRIG
ncbi:hypothetical protein Sru01_59780 [Sphaerisporangium rufum]|uniref:Uncharacterized protein n=1 Tax=Sphaerisporangium rufum TaxID=1381558 RepID=A0A919V1D6_9ACTN|nr:hypothetical protein [Sphaerisporangium rufum]GII80996.1 hypothetical protein Sru01_59780 [Sphaerisporangium rufum]